MLSYFPNGSGLACIAIVVKDIIYKNVRSGRTCPGEIRPCRDEGCSGAARQGKPRSRRAAFAASVFGGALTGLVECSSSNKVSEIAVMVSSRSSEDC